MLKGYTAGPVGLRALEPLPTDLAGAVWLDLESPTREEEEAVERSLGIDVPTREEMAEIEISSRLYEEDGAAYMIALLPARTQTDSPIVAPVTFVLTARALVTVRYHQPRAFRIFPARALRQHVPCGSPELVLFGLLEAVIDRLADVLEEAGAAIDGVAHDVFRERGRSPMTTLELRALLRALGRGGHLVSRLRGSLATVERLLGFLGQVVTERRLDADLRGRLDTLVRDAASLNAHADFLGSKTTFLLEATLGLVNIEQNSIIKIVSVAAVVFLPPTLVASIYGMNFQLMPELDWRFGYPLALLLMVVSAVLPYWFFKRRGWL